MAEIATAYVSLLPSLKGAGKSIGQQLDGPDVRRAAERAGDDIGDRMGKQTGSAMGAAMKGAFVGVTAALGVGALVSELGAASDAGDKFRDTMEFAGFKPKGVEAATKAAQAYADATVYELSDIQGSMASLASNGVKDFAGLTEAAGNLNAVAGGNAETFKSVTQALGQTAGAGKLSTENWNQLADAIPGASGPLQEALRKAGAFTGNFRDAMAEGQITADEFNASLLTLGSKPVAVEAATSTTTFEGALGNLKATIVGALLPAVDTIKPVFTAALSGAAALIPSIVQGFKNLASWIQRNTDWLAPLAGAILAAAAAFGAWRLAVALWTGATKAAAAAQVVMNAVMAANPIGLVVLAIAALVGALVVLYKRNETVRRIIDAAWAGIKTAISAVSTWWTQTAWPAMKSTFEAVGRVVGWLYNNIVKPYFTGWKIIIGAVVDWLVKTAFPAVTNAVKFVGRTFSNVVDGIGKVWGKVKEYAAKPINFVIETVYMNGIKKTWDKVADAVGLNLKLPTVSPIKFASGGVLPGYTPGRDVHEFFSPTGGRLSLSGGEAIMRPEFTRAVGGPAGVARLNSAARAGQAFADGGVWGWAGDIAANVGKFFSNPGGALGDMLSKPLESLLSGIGGGSIGKIAAQLPRKAVGALIEKAKSLLSTVLPGGGKAGPAMGWKAQWAAVKGMFPNAALHSAYRPGAVTAVGTPSFHGKGRAIDVTPSMAIFNWLARAFPNSSELIYSPAGGRQLYMGRQTLFGEPTRSDHFDHIHWAMKNGGVLPKLYDQGGWLPSGGIGVNQTGKPEAVLTPAESNALKDGLHRRPVRSLTFNTTRVTTRDVLFALDVADLHDVGGPA